MKLKNIEKGGHYTAKVSNQIVTVRVDDIIERSTSRMVGYPGKLTYRSTTVFQVTNLRTGRELIFRSAQKFRTRVNPPR